MTKQDWIKWNLEQIARVTGRKWGSGVQAQVKFVRGRLERIEHLLEPESESPVSSVLRLTNICNELGRENATLRNDLTDMTLNYNAAEKHARHLEEEVVRRGDELSVTIRSNVWLRERLTFKDESLRACRAAEKLLKHNLEQTSWDATKLKRELALKEQCLTRVRSRLEWIEQGLESRSVEEENRSLKRELEEAEELKRDLVAADIHTEELQAGIATQNRYIEMLKRDRRQLKQDLTTPSRQNWSWL